MKAYYLKQKDESGEHFIMESDEIPNEWEDSYIQLVKDFSIPYEEVYFDWKEHNNI